MNRIKSSFILSNYYDGDERYYDMVRNDVIFTMAKEMLDIGSIKISTYIDHNDMWNTEPRKIINGECFVCNKDEFNELLGLAMDVKENQSYYNPIGSKLVNLLTKNV